MLLLLLFQLAATDTTAVIRDVTVGPNESIRTTTIGHGNEAVVFIAGIFGGAYGYRHLTIPLAEQGYRCIVIEPLGFGFSSHPNKADYSFTAQTDRIAQVLDSLGVGSAMLVAQSTAASMALRLAYRHPSHVRAILSISGGPAETAATPGLKKSLKYGAFLTKLFVSKGMLHGKVKGDMIANSGDTTWVTDHVVDMYTAGQALDIDGSIDGLRRMSKSKEPESLAARLHEIVVPVVLMVGTAPHQSAVKEDELALMTSQLRDFRIEFVAGSGQYIHEEQAAVVLAAFTLLDGATRPAADASR